MDSPTPPVSRLHRLLIPVTGFFLGLAALIYQGHNVRIAFDPDDTENLETTCTLAAAHQFQAGPAGLYGPYSGENPWVLIHAPLYYRLTGLLALPFVRLGVSPAPACLYGGRVISAFSLIACLAIVAQLCRMAGGSRRAGWLAISIILATPVIGSFPVTMRPDMLGICLQTLGVWLVLRADQDGLAARPRDLILAYVAFGLAACVKQHFIAGVLLSSMLLAFDALRKRLRVGPVAVAHAVGLLIVVSYYGFEQWLTSGMMGKSAFALPSSIQRFTAGSWPYVGIVFLETFKRSVALVALALAAVWAAGARPIRSRLGAFLLVMIAADLALMTKLCLNSSGGWYNYAMQSVIFGAVIVATALDQAFAAPRPAWRVAPVGLAAVLSAVAVSRNVASSYSAREEHREAMAALLGDPQIGARRFDERYFAGSLQHCNRQFGHIELAHDEWLYRAFESIAVVDPRSHWLREALARGPIHQVVVPWDKPNVPGVKESLPVLGYRPVDRFGRYHVWERR